GFLEALAARARALRAAGRPADAMAAFAAVLDRRPDFAPAHVEIAECLLQQGDLRGAAGRYERALALRPDNARTRFHLGQALVLLGEYGRGWDELEWRFAAGAHAARRPFPQPDWPGPPLAGRGLLLWGEQGVGDEILYATMLPALAGEEGRVTVECDPRFVPLFARSFPAMTFVGKRPEPEPALRGDAFDFQCAVGSLGRFYRRGTGDFPAENAFLVPDPALTARLRDDYRARAGDRTVVGISWRSKKDRLGLVKSSAIGDWGTLLRRRDLFFVNLQYGDCAAELAEAKDTFGAEIHQDPAVDPLADLDGFAAQVAAMGLVVTTSNATVHFAGALGRPCRLLLPANVWDLPWYWGAGGDRSLWYPSVRILRMAKDEGWPGLVARAAAGIPAR
ncbi:MAG: tetratricopeptide repeat protein, partial [Acetobacterales bacterium]